MILLESVSSACGAEQSRVGSMSRKQDEQVNKLSYAQEKGNNSNTGL